MCWVTCKSVIYVVYPNFHIYSHIMILILFILMQICSWHFCCLHATNLLVIDTLTSFEKNSTIMNHLTTALTDVFLILVAAKWLQYIITFCDLFASPAKFYGGFLLYFSPPSAKNYDKFLHWFAAEQICSTFQVANESERRALGRKT